MIFLCRDEGLGRACGQIKGRKRKAKKSPGGSAAKQFSFDKPYPKRYINTCKSIFKPLF